MLKSFRFVAGACLLAGLSAATLTAVSAAPVGQPLAMTQTAPGEIEQVRWYGHRGWGGGAFVGGLAAGAIIGGAVAAPYYYGSPYYYGPGYPPPPAAYGPPEGDIQYCMQRYKSYNPNTGLYLGNDGRRHPCP
ncbi:BA14K family protein [Bradyrhizobium manausense]|uniref:BA14K family protein n=1 Tax=Bradyrhizobium manausense TaxID=989370 RepID=UPI001BAD3330|nr:BA14K family protein [Bradyrhizobium manausense]MBR0837612.1 BA14K family protein [Bradyrhizobium manausense]